MINTFEKEHFTASAPGTAFFRAGVEIPRCDFSWRSYTHIKYYTGTTAEDRIFCTDILL